MNDFKSLLNKDALIVKTQTKWVKNISEGNIKLLDQLYSLKVTENKRRLIYNSYNKFINTIPFRINKSKKIEN
jgi:hypothetical protein